MERIENRKVDGPISISASLPHKTSNYFSSTEFKYYRIYFCTFPDDTVVCETLFPTFKSVMRFAGLRWKIFRMVQNNVVRKMNNHYCSRLSTWHSQPRYGIESSTPMTTKLSAQYPFLRNFQLEYDALSITYCALFLNSFIFKIKIFDIFIFKYA